VFNIQYKQVTQSYTDIRFNIYILFYEMLTGKWIRVR
jgi:hypothetical protein